MKHRWIIIFNLIVLIVAVFFVWQTMKKENMNFVIEVNQSLYEAKDQYRLQEKIQGERYVFIPIDDIDQINKAIGEKKVLVDLEIEGTVLGKLAFANQHEDSLIASQRVVGILVIYGIANVFLNFLYYLQLRKGIIKPLKEMKKYHNQIASGNLDFPIPITNEPLYLEFVESLDLMKQEIYTSRQREYKANKEKKDLAASLSHDIKTPLSSMYATVELMMLRETDELALGKLKILENRINQIDELINNLLDESMKDLDALEVATEVVNSQYIKDCIVEADYKNKVIFENTFQSMVLLDPLRTKQVIDNIINNSYKYANSKISVSMERGESQLWVCIKDFGNPVSLEDQLYVFKQYYRGENSKGQLGCGLGLYLAKYFMEKQGGEIEIIFEEGFCVNLAFDLA